MPVLKKQPLEAYIRSRYGPNAQLDSYGPAGKEIRGAKYKQYGYGAPIRLNIRLGRRLLQVVLATMSPGPFGHEHMADRAQAMLWDYDSYGRLPRHVRSLDVGAFTSDGALMSVAAGREYFVLNEWSEGKGYDQDLRRLSKTGKARALDKKRAVAMASYLAAIHRVKRRDPDLYRRRLRELIGHGECIMGLTDSYPKRYAFITEGLLRSIEESCNRWRWKLRGKSSRLSQVHGDFHPWNVLFRRGTDFTVLDRSRGEWGEPADDVTAMTINYLLFSISRWGRLRGPFEVLFRTFWDTYLARSKDREVLRTTAPFFAFRGLVIASPLWYPDLPISARRKLFGFIENVLTTEQFNPADVNQYCNC